MNKERGRSEISRLRGHGRVVGAEGGVFRGERTGSCLRRNKKRGWGLVYFLYYTAADEGEDGHGELEGGHHQEDAPEAGGKSVTNLKADAFIETFQGCLQSGGSHGGGDEKGGDGDAGYGGAGAYKLDEARNDAVGTARCAAEDAAGVGGGEGAHAAALEHDGQHYQEQRGVTVDLGEDEQSCHGGEGAADGEGSGSEAVGESAGDGAHDDHADGNGHHNEACLSGGVALNALEEEGH